MPTEVTRPTPPATPPLPLSAAGQLGLLAALPVACYTLDAKGRITFFNAEAEKLWGRRPVIGEEMWCGSEAMATLDGKPLPLEKCPAAVALRERRPVRGVEAFIIRPDGSRRWVAPHPDPVFDAEGNFLSSTVGSEAWNSRDLKSRPH